MHEGLSSFPRTRVNMSGVVACACNPNAEGAEAGRSPEFTSEPASHPVSQPHLLSERQVPVSQESMDGI